MAKKKFCLKYCDIVICDNIRIEDAMLLIGALCAKYHEESKHTFELIEEGIEVDDEHTD